MKQRKLNNNLDARPKLWTSMYIKLGIATVLLTLVEQIMTVNMSLFLDDLGATEMTIGAAVTVFNVAAMIARFLTGPMLDKKGRLAVGLFGLFLSLIPVVGFIVFPVISVIMILRVLQGVGYSCTSLSQGTMSADIPDPARMDEGVGYYGLFFSVATAIGPAIGLKIEEKFGYNVMFGFCIAVLIGSIIITYTLNYEKKRGIVYTKAKGEKKKLTVADFVEKAAIPTATVGFFASMVTSIVTSFLAVYARKIGIEGTGMFFTISAAMTFAGRLISGKMTAQRKRVSVLLIGNVLMVIGMVVIAFMQSTVQMIIGAVIFGLGGGYTWPALAILAVCDVEESRRGTANSTYYALYDLGLGAGGFVGGLVAGWMGYRELFIVGILISAISVVLTLLLFKKKLKLETAKVQQECL